MGVSLLGDKNTLTLRRGIRRAVLNVLKTEQNKTQNRALPKGQLHGM